MIENLKSNSASQLPSAQIWKFEEMNAKVYDRPPSAHNRLNTCIDFCSLLNSHWNDSRGIEKEEKMCKTIRTERMGEEINNWKLYHTQTSGNWFRRTEKAEIRNSRNIFMPRIPERLRNWRQRVVLKAGYTEVQKRRLGRSEWRGFRLWDLFPDARWPGGHLSPL